MPKEILTCRVNPEIRKALKREAAKDSRTLSWFVEAIINDFVKRKKLT
jgi:predicted transcriptional regulator